MRLKQVNTTAGRGRARVGRRAGLDDTRGRRCRANRWKAALNAFDITDGRHGEYM